MGRVRRLATGSAIFAVLLPPTVRAPGAGALAAVSAISAVLLPPTVAAQAPDAHTLKARGLEFGYNLHYDQALAAFRAAIEANPTDPNAHRLAAATLWISTLFKQGAVTADDYLGEARSDRGATAAAPETPTAP